MPIRHHAVFNDPTNLPNLSVNPYVSKLSEAVAKGYPALYGERLRGLAGQWLKTFDKKCLVLEVGCHKGLVLDAMASQQRDTLHIGMDITFKRVFETARKSFQAQRDNMVAVLANGHGLADLFAAREVDGLIIFYPDPWERKKRQQKNRLVNRAFVQTAKAILKDHSFIWFKTDHCGYFAQVKEEMELAGFVAEESGYKALEPWGILANHKSRFELEFERRQVEKFEAVWVKTRKKLKLSNA